MVKLLQLLRGLRDPLLARGVARLAAEPEPLAEHEAEYLLRSCLNGYLVALGQAGGERFAQSMAELAEREARGGDARRAEAAAFAFDLLGELLRETAGEDLEAARALLDTGRAAFLTAWFRGKAEEDDRRARAMEAFAEEAEDVPTIVYSTDAEGRLTDISHRAAALLGYAKEELLGQHFSLLMQPADAERFGFYLQERRTADRATRRGKLALRAADGGLRTFEVSSTGVYGPDGEYLGTDGIARTVDDEASSLSYQLDQQGRLLAISEAAAAALGYRAEELRGQHFTVLMDERERARVGRLFGERRTDHRAASGIQVQLTGRDGQHRVFEVSAVGRYEDGGGFVGTLGLGRDVTERSELERQVSAERRRYRAICEALPAGLLVVGADRVVREANAWHLKRTLRPLLGSVCHTSVAGRHAHCEWCGLDDALRDGQPTAPTLVTDPLDGRSYVLAWAPLPGDEGEAHEALELRLDVTETLTTWRSAAQEQRRAALERLLDLGARGPSPLWAALAESGGGGDLNQAVAAAAERLALPSGVSLEIDTAPALPPVALSTAVLTELVAALLANALAAGGAEITVETHCDRRRGALLRISDSGAGLSEDEAAAACEAGFTTRPDGAGLGLTLAELHARRAGGALSLTSAAGGGTTVEVRLPAETDREG